MDLFELVKLGNLNELKTAIVYEEINKLKDLKGRSLLFYALINEQEEIFKYLLSQGINPNLVDHSGETVLFEAIKKNKLALAKLLIEKGASIDIANRKGETPLYYIAYNGLVEIIKALKITDYEKYLTNEGLNLMHAAILGGHLEMVSYLTKFYKDNFLLDKMGNSYLHYAARSGDISIADLFVAKKLDINYFNHSFETPLFNAVKLGDLGMTKFLVSKGAYICLKNKHYATALDIAKINDLDNIVNYFTDYLNMPKIKEKAKSEALIIAVLNRDYWEIRQLLESLTDLDHKNQFGLSALDYAKKYKLTLAIDLINQTKKNA